MTYNGPATQPFNMTHMFDFHNPYQKDVIVTRVKEDSIYGKIYSDKDATIFKHCITLAGMQNFFESEYNELTVFVPSDKFLRQIYPESIFTNMDSETALRLVRLTTLNYLLPLDVIRDTPVAQYWTIGPLPKQIFITCSKNSCIPPIINNNVFFINDVDVRTSNGIIHKTSDFIFEV